MTENIEILLKKGRALFGMKRRCDHTNATLVQHHDETFGWFACYQCDRCGQITRQDVSADDLDGANDAPWLDVAMYEETNELLANKLTGDTKINALRFFGKAAR